MSFDPRGRTNDGIGGLFDSVYTTNTLNTQTTGDSGSVNSYDPRLTLKGSMQGGLPIDKESNGEIERQGPKRNVISLKLDEGPNGIELEKKKKSLQRQLTFIKVLVVFFFIGLVGSIALFAISLSE